jgi:dihydrofolate reductase
MRIALIVAVAENGVIGRDGDLPWRMSDDLKWFREATMGKPVIMGRKTYDSIGKPLPGRMNIVLTRSRSGEQDGVRFARDLPAAIALAAEHGASEACVIGGGGVYRAAMPLADRLYVTRIAAKVEGDTNFALPDPADWSITTIRRIAADERNDHAARIEQWDRKDRSE